MLKFFQKLKPKIKAMKKCNLLIISLWCFIVSSNRSWAQQVPDTAFTFSIQATRYPSGEGPLIWVDAAHHNFHTPDNRFFAFAKLARADGFRVQANTEAFSEATLKNGHILVISNSLNAINYNNNWQLPTPSAFTTEEIQAVKNWVKNGGRLFLIADHMPFAGAATDLGKAFGFEFVNCFAMDNRQRNIEYFHRGNKMLQNHEITNGIDTIVTFTGSAFKIPKNAKPILALNETYTLLSPQVAWQFEESTPYVSGAGFYQIATLEYGKGKIFISGEAAMFSAQLAGAGQNPMGMNLPAARQNPQFLLNVLHWLDTDVKK